MKINKLVKLNLSFLLLDSFNFLTFLYQCVGDAVITDITTIGNGNDVMKIL